jgi:hypothetical protein
MPTKIIMKTGAVIYVDDFRSNIVEAWEQVLNGGAELLTCRQLYAGIPLPEVTIDMREIECVFEERR